MSCYHQQNPCNCGNQQPVDKEAELAAQLRTAKRRLTRLIKAVKAAVQQAEEDMNEAKDNSVSSDEVVTAMAETEEQLRSKLGFLSEEG